MEKQELKKRLKLILWKEHYEMNDRKLMLDNPEIADEVLAELWDSIDAQPETDTSFKQILIKRQNRPQPCEKTQEKRVLYRKHRHSKEPPNR